MEGKKEKRVCRVSGKNERVATDRATQNSWLGVRCGSGHAVPSRLRAELPGAMRTPGSEVTTLSVPGGRALGPRTIQRTVRREPLPVTLPLGWGEWGPAHLDLSPGDGEGANWL